MPNLLTQRPGVLFSNLYPNFNPRSILVFDNPSSEKKTERTPENGGESAKGERLSQTGEYLELCQGGRDRLTLEIASKIQIQLERHQVSRMDKKTGVNKDDDDEEKKR
ncbi:MAG: hypothetical protein CM1200mP30_16420 [Pseudomonadota bacterium]|nr:MAG: hypothetical protein CM1200mP30_16420 [Pseudomonadota bacterium]